MQQPFEQWLAERVVPGFSPEHRRAVGVRAFRAHGHHVARALGGTFVHEPLEGVVRTHEVARVELRDASTMVLLHRDMAVLAFAQRDRREPPGLQLPYVYVDAPALARAFGDSFAVAPKHVLDAPCDREMLARFEESYWVPTRVGDLFFNFWD